MNLMCPEFPTCSNNEIVRADKVGNSGLCIDKIGNSYIISIPYVEITRIDEIGDSELISTSYDDADEMCWLTNLKIRRIHDRTTKL